jgi:tetratricopeptide (TPR) repeat protein
MADGVRYEGRFVNPEAYAAYLMGVEHEAHGAYQAALSSYLEAHAEDPDGAEIWARIGAVRCAASTPERGPVAARGAFERGIRNDPNYFGSYLERARCAERARAFPAALADAEAAVALRPSEEAASLLVARLLQAMGRPAEARVWLEGYEAYRLPSAATSRALEASRRGVVKAASSPDALTRSAAFADLESGRLERARIQAQRELDADPTNADAWIASLVVCDALRDAQCFDAALTRLKAPSLLPSPRALGYLRDLLGRRTGARGLF